MERDDIIEYSLHAHHDEEAGKKIRKNIWKVTAILSIITIVEVGVGVMFGRGTVEGFAWEAIKWGYIILTLIKAAYIVLVFMHLGDERKSFKKVVLYPYFLFICYLIFICLVEANFVHDMLLYFGVR